MPGAKKPHDGGSRPKAGHQPKPCRAHERPAEDAGPYLATVWIEAQSWTQR